MLTKTSRTNNFIVRFATKHGNINHRDDNGYTPLHMVVINNSYNTIRCIRILLKKRAQIDLADNFGNTPLFSAVTKNYKRIAKFLLSHGADPNTKVEDGITPLHVCALNSYYKLAIALCRAKANPNAKAANGKTPKMIAAEKGDEKMFAIFQLDGHPDFDNEKLDKQALLLLGLKSR